MVRTGRVESHVREAGSGEPVLFVHGNLSSGAVWAEQLTLLPDGVRGIAVDLRGFGESEAAPVDATRGLRDYADDLRALIDALRLGPVRGHAAPRALRGAAARAPLLMMPRAAPPPRRGALPS
jgi:pimeloyl-ACP methyl ester carboxylesterase